MPCTHRVSLVSPAHRLLLLLPPAAPRPLPRRRSHLPGLRQRLRAVAPRQRQLGLVQCCVSAGRVCAGSQPGLVGQGAAHPQHAAAVGLLDWFRAAGGDLCGALCCVARGSSEAHNVTGRICYCKVRGACCGSTCNPHLAVRCCLGGGAAIEVQVTGKACPCASCKMRVAVQAHAQASVSKPVCLPISSQVLHSRLH